MFLVLVWVSGWVGVGWWGSVLDGVNKSMYISNYGYSDSQTLILTYPTGCLRGKPAATVQPGARQ